MVEYYDIPKWIYLWTNSNFESFHWLCVNWIGIICQLFMISHLDWEATESLVKEPVFGIKYFKSLQFAVTCSWCFSYTFVNVLDYKCYERCKHSKTQKLSPVMCGLHKKNVLVRLCSVCSWVFSYKHIECRCMHIYMHAYWKFNWKLGNLHLIWHPELLTGFLKHLRYTCLRVFPSSDGSSCSALCSVRSWLPT